MDNATYDPQFFARIAAIEEKHFWFSSRARVIRAIVSQTVQSLPPGYVVMEIGCGTGMVLRHLVEVCKQGRVIGLDLYPEAVAFAAAKAGCPVVAGDIAHPPPLERADVIGMFDVLEHLPDDNKALRDVRAMLGPGGVLLLTVPAHMSLWSYFDIAAKHCRRYDRRSLINVLAASGFEIEYVTEFMLATLPLLWLKRRSRSESANDQNTVAEKTLDELQIIPGLNAILKLVLAWEPYAIQRRWQLRGGSSLLAIARRNT